METTFPNKIVSALYSGNFMQKELYLGAFMQE
jgi:hypothetical protein